MALCARLRFCGDTGLCRASRSVGGVRSKNGPEGERRFLLVNCLGLRERLVGGKRGSKLKERGRLSRLGRTLGRGLASPRLRKKKKNTVYADWALENFFGTLDTRALTALCGPVEGLGAPEFPHRLT